MTTVIGQVKSFSKSMVRLKTMMKAVASLIIKDYQRSTEFTLNDIIITHTCQVVKINVRAWNQFVLISMRNNHCWKSASRIYSNQNYSVIVELYREDYGFGLRTSIS